MQPSSLRLRLELPLESARINAANSINIHISQLTYDIELPEGPGTLISEATSLGYMHGLHLDARIEVNYFYDSEKRHLTISRAPGKSVQESALLLYASVPVGQEDDAVRLATTTNSELVKPVLRLPTSASLDTTRGEHPWMSSAALADQELESLLTIARSINAAIIGAAAPKVSCVFEEIRTPSVTEDLTLYQEILGKPDDSWESAAAQIVGLQARLSSYNPTPAHWSSGHFFANVKGSTGDPLPPGSEKEDGWLTFWKKTVNGNANPKFCTSNELFYDSHHEPPMQVVEKHCSKNRIVNHKRWNEPHHGGHVIPGTEPSALKPGAEVYIFPICSTHNNTGNDHLIMQVYPPSPGQKPVIVTGVKLTYQGPPKPHERELL